MSNNIKEIVNTIENGLKDFDPVVLDYGKDKVVGFPNDLNGADLVIYIKEDDIVMTFGYQNAHFAFDDINSVILHTTKYLTGEYTSVEFFLDGKDAFGGSRDTIICKFDDVDDIINCYAMGSKRSIDNLNKLFREHKITVKAINFTNTINSIVNVEYKEDKFIIERIK